MKALAIIALIFASISILVPVIGVYLALLCSLLALIAFCWQPTLSGITIGMNIISTTFLSPSVYLGAGIAEANTRGDGSVVLNILIGFHIVCLGLGLFFLVFKFFCKNKVTKP